jgi:hypothetical protein
VENNPADMSRTGWLVIFLPKSTLPQAGQVVALLDLFFADGMSYSWSVDASRIGARVTKVLVRGYQQRATQAVDKAKKARAVWEVSRSLVVLVVVVFALTFPIEIVYARRTLFSRDRSSTAKSGFLWFLVLVPILIWRWIRGAMT